MNELPNTDKIQGQIIDFGGSGLTPDGLHTILMAIDRDGGVTVRGVAIGSIPRHMTISNSPFSNWIDRHYHGLMMASMVAELILLAYIAFK